MDHQDNYTDSSIVDELISLEEQLRNIDEHIDRLWYQCMDPYLNSTSNQILTDLSKDKFYKVMTVNNPTYKKLLRSWSYFKNQQSK